MATRGLFGDKVHRTVQHREMKKLMFNIYNRQVMFPVNKVRILGQFLH